MLVPVIGLVQVGGQAMADRYTYLPQIGLVIALAWGAKDVLGSWPHRAWACGVVSALVLAALMGCRMAADVLLEQQRGAVDARPRVHWGVRCCPR